MQIPARKYFSNINDKLSWYAITIKNDNAVGYQDANHDAEDVFCFILNVIYDYELENLNKKEINFPGIDLGDYKKRISVQVTSNDSSTKIKDTINTFLRKNYINLFDRLIILIIGEKSNHTATFNSGALTFNPKKDIIGLKELMVEINKLSIEKLKKISEYIDYNISFETSEKGISKAFLPNQYKTVYTLCLTKLTELGIKETTAHTIIKKGISEFTFDFPYRVNYLIGDFGSGKSHILYLYYLYLHNLYIKTTNSQMPIFLNKSLLSSFENIQSWAQKHEISLQNCILIFDGLEEIAYEKIAGVIWELDYLSNYYPNLKSVIGSRHMNILTGKNVISVKPLSLSEMNTLFCQITELNNYDIEFQLDNTNKDAILKTLSKPFFTIIFSVYFEENHYIKSELELMSNFIEKSIHKNQYPNLHDDLARMAVLSLERDLGYIHKSEIDSVIDCEQLLKSGYFLKDEYHNYAFSSPIFVQWFGAEAIRKKYIDIDDILENRKNILKWRYSLSILFSQITYEESRKYFSKII